MKKTVSRANYWKSGKGFFFDTEDKVKYYCSENVPVKRGDVIEFDEDKTAKLLGEAVFTKNIKVTESVVAKKSAVNDPALYDKYRDYQKHLFNECTEDAKEIALKFNSTIEVKDFACIAVSLFDKRCVSRYYYDGEVIE